MSSAVVTALLLGLLVGLVLGAAFMRWALADVGHRDVRPDSVPPPPPTVREEHLPFGTAVSQQMLLAGVAVVLDRRPDALESEAYVERSTKQINGGAHAIARRCAASFAEGAVSMRALLGEVSGVDDLALDEALRAALERHGQKRLEHSGSG